jgi:phosphoserine phosphatase
MPEEIEIDSDKLRETIDSEIERESSRLLRGIALSTAVFAAFAAVVALHAGATVNEALVLKTEATRLQAEASDQWAFYQAKGIKAAVATAGVQSWLAAGKPAPGALTDRATREAGEQQAIRKQAEEHERERDAKSLEADHLLERHHLLADAVALLQVAIALGAVAALTRRRLMWIASMSLGAVGVLLFSLQLLR